MRACLSSMLAALAVVAGPAGCQSSGPGGRAADSVPHLDAEAARATGFSAEEVRAAGGLYETRCAKCHQFYAPAAYSQKEWDEWMQKMSRKSKLQPAQEKLLTRYLGAFRPPPR